MRDILFRGKDCQANRWFEGLVSVSDSGMYHYIVASRTVNRVEPDTITEFTGMYDMNGKRIFEGDVVKEVRFVGEDCFYEVVFRDGCFGLKWFDGVFEEDVYYALYDNDREEGFETETRLEVVGNIYDTPELRDETRR